METSPGAAVITDATIALMALPAPEKEAFSDYTAALAGIDMVHPSIMVLMMSESLDDIP